MLDAYFSIKGFACCNKVKKTYLQLPAFPVLRKIFHFRKKISLPCEFLKILETLVIILLEFPILLYLSPSKINIFSTCPVLESMPQCEILDVIDKKFSCGLVSIFLCFYWNKHIQTELSLNRCFIVRQPCSSTTISKFCLHHTDE